jgi:hypothetical protein
MPRDHPAKPNSQNMSAPEFFAARATVFAPQRRPDADRMKLRASSA